MNAIVSWTQNIAVCLVIVMLLELILPYGNIKKYVKIIIGLYLMFNIISPIVENIKGLKVNNEMFYENYGDNKIAEKMNINIENKTSEIQNTYKEYSNELEKTKDTNIRTIYRENIEQDIKNKISNYEYEAKEVNVKIAEDETYKIEKIEAKVVYVDENMENEENEKVDINNIQEITIDINKDKNIKEKENENNIRELTDQEKDVLSMYLAKDYNISKKSIVIY